MKLPARPIDAPPHGSRPAVLGAGIACRLMVLAAAQLTVSTLALATGEDPFEEADEEALYRVEEQVVTVASRFAQTVDEAPSIVTVITDREIRERGLRTLSDVLRGIPGVYVTVSKESRDLAWFRGVIAPDNSKFLVLVDGVPWYDGVYGHAWIDEYLPLDNVRQIEIIKGPGSAVYGTNAFAGVVNVVTYRARDLEGGFVRAVVGNDGRTGLALVAADRVGRGGNVEVRAMARALGMDGDGLSITPKGRANATGMDPKRSLYGGFGVRVGGFDGRIDFVDHRHTYFVNEQDSPLGVLFESADEFNLSYRNTFASARYEIGLGALGRVTPHTWAQVHDNPSTYAYLGDPVVTQEDDGSFSSELTGTLVQALKKTTRYGGGVEAELRPAAAHTTVGGVGVEATRVDALVDREFVNFSHEWTAPSDFRVDPDAGQIVDLFAYAQHTWTATWWLELTGGARVDQHNFFGTFASPRAGVLLLPSQQARVKVLYGRAFRAPTVRELSVLVGLESDGENRYTAGNPGLSPETIDTVEAEIEGDPASWLTLRAAGFVSRVGDEINVSTKSSPKLGSHYYANLGSGQVFGAEAETIVQAGPVEVDLSGSWTRATDTTTGNVQFGFPPLMGHGRVTWAPVEGLRVSLMTDAYSARPREEWTPNSKRPDLPGFALFHAGLATDPLLGGRMRVDLSLRNVLNTAFEEPLYRDDSDATTTDDTGATVAKYPRDLEGEGRMGVVGVEVLF
jgi:outer membrane receptor protein involved in Fe transport